ncbi:serine/threonine protein phosphatase 1 [Bradyrhizobium sp. BR13661]|nr:serine/threonine protein phosphatase 1 [Bradyrhizobium sp. BR13661]
MMSRPLNLTRFPILVKRLASLPEDLRIYAFGDIHGRCDLLDRCLSKVDRDLSERPTRHQLLVFLGDYIDRGSQSRETVSRLVETAAKYECVFLKGNHEHIAMRSLTDLSVMPNWLRLGGLETLQSYGVTPVISPDRRDAVAIQIAFQNALPSSHFRFFGGLKNQFVCHDMFFVHAGIRPAIDLSAQREEDLLWIRDEFLRSNRDFGKIVVHGHTPTVCVDVQPNRINIDTGAYSSGRLTCLVLEHDQISIIDTDTP